MFTVVIPTFNRPELLRIALTSVSKQTIVQNINKVIVSENGLNKESELVCSEFKNINIVYKYQNDQLSMPKHLQWLLSLEQEDYVAFLCDDDWWDVNHLEIAKKSIENNDNNVCYFSNFSYVKNRFSLKRSALQKGEEVFHMKNDFINYEPILYSKEHIFLFSVFVTPFHFSTMICKGDILSKSVEIFDQIHPTNADRLLFAAISGFGTIIFNPLRTCIVLWHDNMESHVYNSEEWKIERQKGSLKVMEFAQSIGIDIKTLINEAYTENKFDDSSFISKEISDIFFDRDNIQWFSGLEEITKNDQDLYKIMNYKKSLKGKIKNKINLFFKKIAN
ncbi:glycosyltransferase family 2 protein [Hymenobacter sp. NBH84]|uniref:glycosyltransferase family A protein n=1 Tax=Hymenobacter sp. NBH84 TaxID=2596915 RepID=UPI001626C491|nr:glycosyltransferase family A protein [Hymenobacter sp. NBH84]QNE38414.1 glycosyltransferase family 2 protein [Hymenobacter sp. NBH84]